MGNCLTEEPPRPGEASLESGIRICGSWNLPCEIFFPGVSGDLGGLIERPAGLVEE